MPDHVSPLPSSDSAGLLDRLGIKGYVDDMALPQYVKWFDDAGGFEALERQPGATSSELVEQTSLTAVGVESLLGVMAALGLVTPRSEPVSADRQWWLTNEAIDYVLASSPFHMGDALYFSTLPAAPPPAFVDADHPDVAGRRNRLRNLVGRSAWKAIRGLARLDTGSSRGFRSGEPKRLQNQNDRNAAPCAMAAGLDIVSDATTVIDVGGGTGPFAVPLHRRHPAMRVIVTDLPNVVDGVHAALAQQQAPGVEVLPLDVLDDSWPLPDCDLMFFGNLLHIFNDTKSRQIVERAARHLRASGGGEAILHEMVWNEERTGPLETALFHMTMSSFGGKQRTIAELEELLTEAGFTDLFTEPTCGGFVAVGGSIASG